MIIAVDFDDTICFNNKFPEPGPPVPGALDALRNFEEAGAKIILWTMRSEDALAMAVDFLKKNGIQPWGSTQILSKVHGPRALKSTQTSTSITQRMVFH